MRSLSRRAARLAGAARRNAVLLALPPRVALFYSRARRLAARSGDGFSLEAATGPESLARLLRLARGRRRVVEIGTASGWTAVALALAEPQRSVMTFDPIAHPERERYLALAPADVRARIELVEAPGERGPEPGAPAPDFVFVDGSHERDRTIETFRVWSAAVAPGGIVAFHDFGNPLYPGVGQAITALDLGGEVERDVFVWRKP